MFFILAEIEIPSIVEKTRALLALRGFGTYELLEYEDRYVMHPQGTLADVSVKYVIWILKEERVVGVAIVRDLFKEMEESESQRGMLVGGNRFTPAAKKYSKASRIELVQGHYASFDLFDHVLVPSHIIAEQSEVDLVLGHYKIDKTQLPRIYTTDAAAKVLGARVGQIIRIERDSETAGRTFYYRLVIDP